MSGARRLSRRALLRASGAAVSAVANAGCAHEVKHYATRPGRADADGILHIGNSTHLVVLNGVHVLTDPWLQDPADRVLNHRLPPAPLPVDVDVILVTHEHEDHFDEAALALVDKKACVVVPDWLVARTKALGFEDVRGCKSGDVVSDVRGLTVDVARARHDIDEVVYRFGFGVSDAAGPRIFFGGDTLPTPEIDLLAKGGADFCILPADAGALMGERYVMNVDEAVAMASRFGVDQPKKGAFLSHHECELTSSVWSVILDVKPVDTSKLPAWFAALTPGQQMPFPWQVPS